MKVKLSQLSGPRITFENQFQKYDSNFETELRCTFDVTSKKLWQLILAQI